MSFSPVALLPTVAAAWRWGVRADVAASHSRPLPRRCHCRGALRLPRLPRACARRQRHVSGACGPRPAAVLSAAMPAKDRREAKAEREATKSVEKSAKQKQQEEVRPARRLRDRKRQRPKRTPPRAPPRHCGLRPLGGGCVREARGALRCSGCHGRCSACARQQGGTSAEKTLRLVERAICGCVCLRSFADALARCRTRTGPLRARAPKARPARRRTTTRRGGASTRLASFSLCAGAPR